MQIDLKSNVGLQVMPIDELIERVASVCKRCGAEHLDLFGSFATGTATARSDIDFVVYGDVDSELLNQMISQIAVSYTHLYPARIKHVAPFWLEMILHLR